jgi:hypothetical protein
MAGSTDHTTTNTGNQQKGYIAGAVEKTMEGLEKTKEYIRETVTGHEDKPVTEHMAEKGGEMKQNAYSAAQRAKDTASNAHQNVMDTATDTKHDIKSAANKGTDHAKHATNKY